MGNGGCDPVNLLARRHLQFFERHVRGRDVDTGPTFAWFRDWVDHDVEQTGGTAAPAYNQTLIRRQVAPARIPDEALAAGPVDVRLVGLSRRFEAGHRLRLVLASTDQAYFNNRLVDHLTVTSTPEEPSMLTLPIVPASVDGAGPAPDDGAGPAPDPAPDDSSDDTPDLATTGGGVAVPALVLCAAAVATRTRRR